MTWARSPARPSGRRASRRARSRRSAGRVRTRTGARIAASWRSSTASRRTGVACSAAMSRGRTRLFEGEIETGCGPATRRPAPSTAPRRYVYLDLGFFEQLQTRFGARDGPLAEAYVLAHEYGHHVQHLTGVLDRPPGDRSAGRPGAGRATGRLLRGLWVGHAVDTGLPRAPDPPGSRGRARRGRGRR